MQEKFLAQQRSFEVRYIEQCIFTQVLGTRRYYQRSYIDDSKGSLAEMKYKKQMSRTVFLKATMNWKY